MLETVVGTNGILVPPDGYLQGVRELCDDHGIVFIADEVMAGFGRCGEWFAVDRWDVTPDLICFAKGVNSGYVPLGGVIISRPIADTFADRVYPGGLTYSGHPLACASAVASINIFKEEGIIEHARHLGDDVVGPALAEIAERHPSVGEVRGLGVFWAIELVRDRGTREPLVPYNAAGAANKPMVDVAAACKARGLWPFTHFNRLHVVPPITISDDDMRSRAGDHRRGARRRRRARHGLTSPRPPSRRLNRPGAPVLHPGSSRAARALAGHPRRPIGALGAARRATSAAASASSPTSCCAPSGGRRRAASS